VLTGHAKTLMAALDRRLGPGEGLHFSADDGSAHGWFPCGTICTLRASVVDLEAAQRIDFLERTLRKNSLFVATPRGGQTAAILSSFTSTCQRHAVNPQAYLTQLLANLPDTPVSQLDQWLPDQWQKTPAAAPAPTPAPQS
jgi:hypothetical protein